MNPSTQLIQRRQRGFTLIELMVAVAIGLLLLAGLSTMHKWRSRAPIGKWRMAAMRCN
jgi:type IV pilus assembly protein PilW